MFPILIAAPQYIAGAMTLGLLMQAAQAFQRLTSALSSPIDNLGELARSRASVDRILGLHEDLLAREDEAPLVERWRSKITLRQAGACMKPRYSRWLRKPSWNTTATRSAGQCLRMRA